MAADWKAPTDDEQAALDALGPKGGRWEVDGTEVKLTNLDKVLLPADHDGDRPEVTKRHLVSHLTSLAPELGRYLNGRAVNVLRLPDGLGKRTFWQQALPSGTPDWVQRWRDPEATGKRAHDRPVLDGPASLAWMANLAAVELHPWTSAAATPEVPDWALIDIDPGDDTTWDDTLTMARLFRTALAQLDLRGCPKVTGKRGIQIWVPAGGDADFASTSGFVERLSHLVGDTVPDLVSWRWHTDERRGRARLDYTQNARHKTLVAPWSVRAAPGGPVSVPIDWDELDDDDLAPDRWCVDDVRERLETHGDPLGELVGITQELPEL